MARRTASRLLVILVGVAAALALGAQPALAQPPPNDDFDNAIVITSLPFQDTQDTTEATTAPDDPECVGQGPTVWYRFTPSADASIVAHTAGSDYDTTLSAYTGTRGSLTQIACNDDAIGLQSRIQLDVTAGTTYHFMVGSFASGPGGNLVFSVEELPPPMELAVDLARNGTVNRAGVATLRGTLTCSREGQVDLTVGASVTGCPSASPLPPSTVTAPNDGGSGSSARPEASGPAAPSAWRSPGSKTQPAWRW